MTVVPLPFGGLQLDRPTVGLHELAGQREAEAERRFAAQAGLDDAVEAVEDAGQVLAAMPGPLSVILITACFSSPPASSRMRPLRSL